MISYLPELELLLSLVAGVLDDPAQWTLVAAVTIPPAVPAGAALTVDSLRPGLGQ